MASEIAETQGSEQGRSAGQYLANHLRDYGMVLALIAIMAFFQVMTDGTLLRPVNITNLFLQTATSSSWRWACCW
jgi:putative multiple sugar transport system permease protein